MNRSGVHVSLACQMFPATVKPRSDIFVPSLQASHTTLK